MTNLTVDLQTDPSISNNQISVNPSPHNLPRSVLVGILIFVLLSATAYGAYWYTKNYLVVPSSQSIISNAPSEVPQSKTSFSNLNNQTTPVPVDETANWKTYTNSKFNFSLKYPPSLVKCCGISGPISGNPEEIITLGSSSKAGRGTDAPFDGFAIYVETNLSNLKLSQYISQEKQALLGIYKASEGKDPTGRGIESMFMIAGRQGTILKNYSWDDVTRYYVNFPDEKKILVFAKIKVNGTFDTTFDQILSTFKFL